MMDIKTYIQHQMANVRGYLEAVIQDTTDEQANWPPPGSLSPISAIYLHMVAGEDYFIQTFIQGTPPCGIRTSGVRKSEFPNRPNKLPVGNHLEPVRYPWLLFFPISRQSKPQPISIWHP